MSSRPLLSTTSTPSLVRTLTLAILCWACLGCFCFDLDDEHEGFDDVHPSDVSPQETDEARRESSPSSSSSSAMKQGERRKVEVDAVWFQQSTKSGGTSPVEVRVEGTPGGKPAVAVMEQHVDGTGNSWQAAAWLAAINASRVTGNKLGDHEFVVKSGGFIDGPSAGMLVTATMLALIKGERVREDSTMTGTINPDGTAGPVGGIPQKIEGAKASGKKRFGFPIGTQRAFDMKTGKTVDVVAYGDKLGVETKEIKNLYEAYAFLTGSELERATPVREGEMALGPELEKDLHERIARFEDAFDKDVDAFKAQQKRAPKAVAALSVPYLEAAAELFKQGDVHRAQGDLALAYYRFRQGGALVAIAALQMSINTFVVKGEFSAAINALRTERARFDRELAALHQDIEKAASAGTIGGQVNAVNALMSVQMATTQMQIAQAYFEPLKPTLNKLLTSKSRAEREKLSEQLLALLSLPLRYYARSSVQISIAADQLRTPHADGKASVSSTRQIQDLAGVYASAAGAGLYNVDALVLEGLATQQGITMEKASDLLARKDDGYAMARGATKYAKVLGQQLEKGSLEYALSDLAAGVLAYNYAAELVNKYYALELDANTQRVNKPRVLILQLEQARIQARETAALAKAKLGFVPSSARFYYQMANSLSAQNSDGDRLYGLSLYWMSSFWSELALALG
jgi:uncharacterized protein